MPNNYSALTSKQKKVLSVIESFINSRGISPSVREIGEKIGEKTPGAVQGILNRLEQKRVITREAGMARSIRIVLEDTNYVTPIYVPEVKNINTRNIDDIFNVYNIIKNHPLSSVMFDSNNKYFIIKCPDKSLNGISYDDILIIGQNSDFKDSDILLVLYDTHLLLRRYYTAEKSDRLILKAEGNILGKDEFHADEIRIIGKLMGRLTIY